jgi:Fe2+ transport system protein FeoA
MSDKPMEESRELKSLIEIRDGQLAIIVSVSGGRSLTKRLADLGLRSGIMVKVLRSPLFSGPVQIEVCGSRLVLGQGLASKIMVRER